MKVIVNKYQKTLGFIKCSACKSVLRIDKTDRNYQHIGNGITGQYFICGACGHKQFYESKQLTSKRKIMAEAGDEHD